MTPEQRAARLHYHMYDSLEGIEQQSERIVALEEIALRMWEELDKCCAVQHTWAPNPPSYDKVMQFANDLHELGVEVE